VLDIYSPKQKQNNAPTLLFVHGGMWLRGSKEQQPLSLYNVVSHVASQTYHGAIDRTTNQDLYSNVGLTVAKHGGVACVMNYRLAHGKEETGHPHQVMDVARAIAVLISRSASTPLHLYVGGHSAGAHLAALVLCDPQFLRKAMEENGLDFKEMARNLRGFIGISGVYNLRRLAMSPLAEITIGPAFLGHEDVTMEASPVHVLLQAHASQSDGLPPLATLPLLLLNAESDFHLWQDTCELEIALDQFPVTVERQSVVISNRNHLSIMGEFGQGLISRDVLLDEPSPDQESWSLAYLLHQSQAAVSAASAYVPPYFLSDSTEAPDGASLHVLEFMRLKE
jgi:hypothetical protein